MEAWEEAIVAHGAGGSIAAHRMRENNFLDFRKDGLRCNRIDSY